MPIEITDLHDGLGNIIIGRGVITEEEYVATLKEHLTQDENKFKKYRFSLADYTAATKVDISSQAIKLIADFCIAAAVSNPEAVVAVVADQDLTFGLARMSEILMAKTGWESQVFRNRKDAESWIQKRIKEKYGLDDVAFG